MMNIAHFALLCCVAAGTLKVDLQKGHSRSTTKTSNTAINQLYEKSLENNVVPDHLINGHWPYSAVLYIGSDAQRIVLPVDTSQGDLYIRAGNSTYCSNFNCSNVFNTEKSSTYYNTFKKVIPSRYPSWFSHDKVQIGDAAIQNASFVISESGIKTGSYFGVSFKDMEQTLNSEIDGTDQGYGGFTYPNIPMMLKQQGYIGIISFSLYMNTDDSDGMLLFGGVDHSKYTGDLGIVPMVNVFHPHRKAEELMIMLHQVSISSANTSCKLATMESPVLLDSSLPEGTLPMSAVKSMGESMGLSYNSTISKYIGSCNLKVPFDYFVFDFSGIEIKVPPKELLEKAVDYSGKPVLDSDGEALCMLALYSIDTITSLSIGEKILRYMYMAFDLENYEVALAQAKPGSTNSSEIEPIVSKLPGTSAPSYSSTYWHWFAKTFDSYQSCLQVSTTTTSVASHSSTPSPA